VRTKRSDVLAGGVCYVENVRRRLDFGKDLFDENGCSGWSLVDGHEEDILWSHGQMKDEAKDEDGKELSQLEKQGRFPGDLLCIANTVVRKTVRRTRLFMVRHSTSLSSALEDALDYTESLMARHDWDRQYERLTAEAALVRLEVFACLHEQRKWSAT
jgi:hypothetical protein